MIQCCCGTGEDCVTVTGCGGVAVGAGSLVTLKKAGVTIGTCTTDGTGRCCIPITVAGSGYTVTAGPPSGTHYQSTTSSSLTLTLGTNNTTLQLLPATGFICGPTSGSGSACCGSRSPVTITDATGTYTLVRQLGAGTANDGHWRGCDFFTNPNSVIIQNRSCPAGAHGGAGLYEYGQSASKSCPVVRDVWCDGTGWHLVYNYAYAFSNTSCPNQATITQDSFVYDGACGAEDAGYPLTVASFGLQEGGVANVIGTLSGTCTSASFTLSGTVPTTGPSYSTATVSLPFGGTIAVSGVYP